MSSKSPKGSLLAIRVALNVSDQVADGDKVQATLVDDSTNVSLPAAHSAAPLFPHPIVTQNSCLRVEIHLMFVRRFWPIAAILALAVSGCEVGPNYKPPAVSVSPAFDTSAHDPSERYHTPCEPTPRRFRPLVAILQ